MITIIGSVLVAALAACSGKSDVEYYQDALREMERGKANAAVIHLKNALRRNANHRDARFLLGKIYVEYREGAAAEKELKKAQELGVSDTELTIQLARAYLYQQKNDDALAVLKDFPAASKEEQAWRHSLQGDAYLDKEDAQKALDAYRLALEADKQFIPALVGLARLEMFGRNNAAALQYVQSVLEIRSDSVDALILKGEIASLSQEYPAAVAALKRALEVESGKPIAAQAFYIRSRLADTLVAQNDYPAALQQIESLAKDFPQNPIPKYLRAVVAYRQGDLPLADENLQSALKIAPSHRPSLLLLGAVNFAKGNYEQARAYLSSLLAEDPANADARKWLSAANIRLKRPDRAVELLKPVMDQDASDVQALDILGEAAIARGDTEEAIGFMRKAVKESPDAVALRNKLAIAYLNSGDADRAIEELESAVVQKKQNYQSQALLVASYLQKRDYENAQKLAQTLVNSYPDEPHAAIMLANVYMLQGKDREAQEVLTDLRNRDPNSVQALVNLARVAFKQENYAAAQDYLQKASALDQGNVSILLALAQVAQKTGDIDQALKWLNDARGRNANAIAPRILLARYYLYKGNVAEADKLVGEAQRADAENPAVLVLRGMTDLKLERIDSAAKSLAKVTGQFDQYAEGHFYYAQVLLRQKKADAAAAELQKAVQVAPNYLNAQWALAKLYMQTGQFAAAQQRVNVIKTQFKDTAVGSVLQGDLYMTQKEFRQALGEYQKAAQQQSHSDLVLRQFAALSRLAEHAKAEKLLQAWLQQHPEDNKAWLTLAQSYQARGQNSNAIAQYRRALESGKEDPALLNNLAWLLHETGDKAATEYAERAHKLAPEQGAITDTLGWLYLQDGDHVKALSLLAKAAQQSPNVPDIQYHYAAALARNGKQADAKQILTALLQGGGEFSSKSAAQQLLQNIQ